MLLNSQLIGVGFFLVFDLTQATINSALIKAIFIENSINISNFVRLPNFSYENQPKLALCILAKIAQFGVLAEKMLVLN